MKITHCHDQLPTRPYVEQIFWSVERYGNLQYGFSFAIRYGKFHKSLNNDIIISVIMIDISNFKWIVFP